LLTKIFQHDFKIDFDKLNQNANGIFFSNSSLATLRYDIKHPIKHPKVFVQFWNTIREHLNKILNYFQPYAIAEPISNVKD
jgi:hypothetical protein